MNTYTVFNQSLVGYKHIQNGYQNEDCAESYQNKDVKIIAVADGHGARECFRSWIGAKIAADSALEMLKIFANTVEEYNLLPNLYKYDQREELIRALIHDLIEMWNERVHTHIKEYPIQEEEYLQAKTLSTIYQKGMYLTNIYGTTLLGAILTNDFLLVLQQGDGNCILIDEDGNFTEPIAKDDLCVRHMTTSLCDKDAEKRMRYAYFDLKGKNIGALYLASDGVSDSFADEIQMEAFYAELSKELVNIEDGKEDLYLLPLLERVSEYGSKDDISIAGIINKEVLKKANEHIDLLAQKAMDHRRMMDAQKKWMSFGHQKKQLNKEYVQLQKSIQKLDDRIAQINEEKEEIFKTMDSLMAKHSQVVTLEKEAKDDLEKCMEVCKRVEIELQRKE